MLGEKWWVRNLAQTVTKGYLAREEFISSAQLSLLGCEAPGSVEMTFILRAMLRQDRRVRI